MKRLRASVLVPALALLAGCNAVSSNYTGEITRADPSRIIVCHGHDCARKERMDITAADAARFRAIMAQGAASPEAERRAISDAVQYFEERSVQVVGGRDRAKSQIGPIFQPGQMDCIDESTNTQSLLKYLAVTGLLRHHKVEGNAARGFVVDFTLPHATAVIRDPSGRKWAVDSWERPAGAAPDIMPLEEWVRNGGLSEAINGKVS